MSRKLPYEQVDVFTEKAFGGNQLAVFHSPGKLTRRQLQLIASEMNFSETTFIYPPKHKDAQARVRIFTPAEELPFAGHPVLGTAFVMMNRIKGKKPDSMDLELGVGRIKIDFDYSSKSSTKVTMHQPVPQFGTALENRGQAARAVGIKGFEVMGGGVVSNGMNFLIVEARDTEVVKRAHLNMEEALMVINRHKTTGIYLFARMESRRANIHARFFAPNLSISEDPATGSGAGALGGYMARLLKFPADLKLVIEQGKEMGRPSKLYANVHCDRGMVHSVKVTGAVVSVGEGWISIP